MHERVNGCGKGCQIVTRADAYECCALTRREADTAVEVGKRPVLAVRRAFRDDRGSGRTLEMFHRAETDSDAMVSGHIVRDRGTIHGGRFDVYSGTLQIGGNRSEWIRAAVRFEQGATVLRRVMRL